MSLCASVSSYEQLRQDNQLTNTNHSDEFVRHILNETQKGMKNQLRCAQSLDWSMSL